MITEALMDFFFAIPMLILSLIPQTAAPAWIAQANGYASALWTDAADLGAWIPWGAVAVVVGAWFTAFGIRIVVVILRFLLSLFTGGGGAAG